MVAYTYILSLFRRRRDVSGEHRLLFIISSWLVSVFFHTTNFAYIAVHKAVYKALQMDALLLLFGLSHWEIDTCIAYTRRVCLFGFWWYPHRSILRFTTAFAVSPQTPPIPTDYEIPSILLLFFSFSCVILTASYIIFLTLSNSPKRGSASLRYNATETARTVSTQ